MPTSEESPTELRERAATARRLASGLSPRDADRLNQIAHDLEARASALEEAQTNDEDGEARSSDCNTG
jgi:hypothetical protein